MNDSRISAPPLSRRVDASAVAVVGIVALVPRLLIALTAPDYPLMADFQEYWERAAFVFEHGRLYDNSWRMPGYPAVLALAFAVARPSLEVARLVNVVAGTVTVLLTYWLARRTTGPRPALVAALVVALYPSFLIYTTLIVTEPLVTVPMVGALIAASYSSRRAAALSGLCAGLMAMVRPAGIALLPAIAFMAARGQARESRTRWFARPLLALAMFALVMMPWWIHNARLHARFIPLDTTGSYNLLVGNLPFSTGIWEWSVVGRMEADYLKNGLDWKSPAGADWASALASDYIRSHPMDTLRRVPVRLAGLFALEGREIAYLYSWDYLGRRQPSTIWLWGTFVVAAFPALAIAAVVGVAVRGGVAPRVLWPSLIFLAVTVAMHAISFGDPRFHLPMVPVLAVMATALARWRDGISLLYVSVGILIVALLIGPWSTQFSTYWNAMPRLTAPDGWKANLAYDDLL